MNEKSAQTRLRLAAVLTLLALVLMVSSLLHPHPILVILAMSAGQALGTLAFLLYLWVIVSDLRAARVLARARRASERS